MTRERRPRAIVYSCSGSSNVAQLANHLAVRLDRAGLAEMSCIAGVGGNVKPLVRKASSGAPIVLIDGCPLRCCEHVLAARGVEPTLAIRLHERGLRKVQHTDFTENERDEVYRDVLVEIAPILAEPDPSIAELVEAELVDRDRLTEIVGVPVARPVAAAAETAAARTNRAAERARAAR